MLRMCVTCKPPMSASYIAEPLHVVTVVSIINAYRDGSFVFIFHLEFLTLVIALWKKPSALYMNSILELIVTVSILKSKVELIY